MNYLDIPFSDRVLDLPSGFSLIWPFRNVPRSIGPYELILDNNALIRSAWLRQLPASIENKIVLSPFHALSEQWLSNSEFKNNPAEGIEKLIIPFIQSGISFEKNYANNLSHLLEVNDNEIKSQWMLSYLYVVLLYRLVSSKKGDLKPKQLLSSLRDIDVPRFNGLTMLCTLAVYLKENQNLKLIGDEVTAYSYISKFVALQPIKKNEDSVGVSYLRNRAGDLSLWLCLPALVQNNYERAGELVVVTGDNVLRKLLFRCFPSVETESGQMGFSFDSNSFEVVHYESILQRIEANTSDTNIPKSRKEQIQKLQRLCSHVLEGAENELIFEVETVWKEWVAPGFFGEFTL
jgi:hypothetical protein